MWCPLLLCLSFSLLLSLHLELAEEFCICNWFLKASNRKYFNIIIKYPKIELISMLSVTNLIIAFLPILCVQPDLLKF